MFDLAGAGDNEWFRPALSPDGKTILFPDGDHRPWRLDVGSGKVARINDQPNYFDARWLPDSKRAILTRLESHLLERVDVNTGRVELTCRLPFRLGAEFLDDGHMIVLADRIYAAGFDCDDESR